MGVDALMLFAGYAKPIGGGDGFREELNPSY
jgi:hypothetical protein